MPKFKLKLWIILGEFVKVWEHTNMNNLIVHICMFLEIVIYTWSILNFSFNSVIFDSWCDSMSYMTENSCFWVEHSWILCWVTMLWLVLHIAIQTQPSWTHTNGNTHFMYCTIGYSLVENYISTHLTFLCSLYILTVRVYSF